MENELVISLMSIYTLAKASGLIDYIKKLPEKTFDAAYEKLVQDGLLPQLFPPQLQKACKKALQGIASFDHDTLGYTLILSLITEQEIIRALEAIEHGQLPQRQLLVPAFQKVFPGENAWRYVNLFMDNFYNELKKDDETVKLVMLMQAEKMNGLHALLEEIRDAVKSAPSSHQKEPLKISLAQLPSTSPNLFGREKELEILDKAWNNPQTNIVSLVAWGGVGKTALVNVWLNQMEQSQYRGAERAYGYSFYSQGAAEGKQASADLFIATALAWFGDPEPDKGSPWDKGERLAELIKRQRTLLILDGLEPLQHPPREMEGRLKDPGLQCLLRELARHNPGLCIVTTRLSVDELKDFVGSSVEQIELEHLSPEAGATYLKHLGVKGTNDELRQAASEFDGHALALTLLGRYLAVVYHGEIRQRDRIAQLTKEKKQGGHARRVMESYERWFQDKPELNILHIMGLFDRPAEGSAIEVLKAKPAIKGLTDALQELSHEDWQYVLNNLREVRLLVKEDLQNSNTLDCHPLVREHFGEKLKAGNATAWKEAHSRLYEYYKSVAKEYPDTIEEMTPLYAAVSHGGHAGRGQDALDEIFKPRIQRGHKRFSWRQLGLHSADLAALSGFFKQPWNYVFVELSEENKAFVFYTVGYVLRAVTRLEEAVKPMLMGLEMYIRIDNKEEAAVAAVNLGELYLTLGRLSNAIDVAKQSVEYADQSNSNSWRIASRTGLADCWHQAGYFLEAEKNFWDAEELNKQIDPDYPILHSAPGYRFYELLFDQGNYQEVENRVNQTLQWSKQKNLSLLTIAMEHRLLGQAYSLKARYESTPDFSLAKIHFDKAVQDLRRGGQHDYLPFGLLAKAELYRIIDELEIAKRDLDEAFTIAIRGGMRLHEADCHLEYARLHLAMGENGKARENWAKAKKMIEEMGYHRRDPEIHLIEAQLHLSSGEKDKTRESLAKAKEFIDKMGMHRWDFEVKEIEEQLGGRA